MTQCPRTFHGHLLCKCEDVVPHQSGPEMSVAGGDNYSAIYTTSQIWMALIPYITDSRMSRLLEFPLYPVSSCYPRYVSICSWIHHYPCHWGWVLQSHQLCRGANPKQIIAFCCWCHHHLCPSWSLVNGSRAGAMWLYFGINLVMLKETSLLQNAQWSKCRRIRLQNCLRSRVL